MISDHQSGVVFAFTLSNPAFPQASFEAKREGPDRLVGTWIQGPYKTPLTLTRGDPEGWADWAIYNGPAAPLTKARLDIYRRTFLVPALTAGARRAGRTAIWSTGVRQVGSSVPVTDQDQWRIGSISKSMTATLVARLVEAGAVKWDDQCGQVIGELKSEMRPEYAAATYRHLLCHRAGLINNLTPDELDTYSFSSPDPREERVRYMRTTLARAPVAALGQRFSYSSAGYVTAAGMLEASLGQSWEALMREHVFKPLGLKSAGFGSPGRAGRIEQPFGHVLGLNGYERVSGGGGLDDIPAVVGPAGGIHVNMADLLTFLAAHSERTPFLKPETWDTLQTPWAGGRYAMGWTVSPEGVLRHGGATKLWLAQVSVDRSQGVCAAAATNVNGAIRAVTRAAEEAVAASQAAV